MRLALVVNALRNRDREAATYSLAAEAVQSGHSVWLVSTGRFSYLPDGRVALMARRVPEGVRGADLLGELQENVRDQELMLDSLDVLWLRNNPVVQRPWAQRAGIEFGRLAVQRGVLVVNDPDGLARGMNKLYLESFPEQVRPRTLITRSLKRVQRFVDELGTAVVKPLQGSGGRDVFLVQAEHSDNLESIVRTVRGSGYVIAQEYLPGAAQGDTRLYLLNGYPLQVKGHYAVVGRTRNGEDIRSNVHAGGTPCRAPCTPEILRIAELVRPRLIADGMFLVALDIAGDRIMEINTFSPGGIAVAERFEGVDFHRPIIEALELKVRHMRRAPRRLPNAVLATL